MDAPNQVWSADFKGEFRLGDGSLCYPLTVTDAHTRFLLACEDLPSTGGAGARPVFQRLFTTHGLPTAIRTDNGAPFVGPALAGLSALSAWWTPLGIRHQRIEPGHPEQNGRHERMHRTLKAEATRPPAPDLGTQQERFACFQQEYNTVRPHEALGQRSPASQYRGADRPAPTVLPEPGYAGHLEVRKVGASGNIRFRRERVFVSQVLVGETVGLEEVADGIWSVYFYDLLLGRLREGHSRIV